MPYSVNRTIADSRGRQYLVVGDVDIEQIGGRLAHLMLRFTPKQSPPPPLRLAKKPEKQS